MKRYLAAYSCVLAFLLLIFIVVQKAGVALLTNPIPWLEQSGPMAALLGVMLLTADIVVPVPTSIVMTTLGALFGAFGGAVLSLIGGLGSALLGFSIGRQGGSLLARYTTPSEQDRANQLLSRWGGLAVVVSRPIPLLGETVAILAGTSLMSWKKMTVASMVGLLPGAVLYALVGSFAITFQATVFVFILAIAVTAIFWLVGLLINHHTVGH